MEHFVAGTTARCAAILIGVNVKQPVTITTNYGIVKLSWSEKKVILVLDIR